MKSYNIFDVVELNNGNKATIITNENATIKVEEVNNKGISLGVKNITDKDIKQVISILQTRQQVFGLIQFLMIRKK